MSIRPSDPPRILLDYLKELVHADDGDRRIDQCDFTEEDIGLLYEARHWIQEQLSSSTDFRQRERLVKQLEKVLAAIHFRTDQLNTGTKDED